MTAATHIEVGDVPDPLGTADGAAAQAGKSAGETSPPIS